MQLITYLLKCQIISNKCVGENIHLIRVSNTEISSSANSGQFVNIRISDGFSPFWRRPFSIHRVDREQGWFDVLFAVLGHGTQILAAKNPGDTIDVVGPLGTHFYIDHELDEAILVAGGLGIAPMLFLAEELTQNGISPLLFYGTKTHKTMCCLDDFDHLGIKSVLVTEDGSKEYKGLVTERLEDYLRKNQRPHKYSVLACGPIPMLRMVQKIAQRYNVSGQISIETLMACGIGICMGCPVETAESHAGKPNYLLSCKDGPVFKIDRIKLNGRSFD
jgi:dihydroorotate dehydrogenase electron transfer subunit